MRSVLVIISIFIIAGNVSALENSWTASLPGYNMGTTYSYYQPLLASFNSDEINGFLKLDPILNHRIINNPGFVLRYSITKNLQIGLHFNSQLDQWDKTSSLTPPDTLTTITERRIASLTSYLPTAVLIYRMPVAKGYFSAGGGAGYYLVKYRASIDTTTIVENGTADTTTSAVAYLNEVYGGAFGAQAFFEFTYPVFRDIFFFSARAGYVFCTIPQPFAVIDSAEGVSYSLPDIDLSGLLATIGFTAEF